ncbi:hypothetical protein K501DRAFT_154028, partial [Backusella circina FSU 941]
QWSCSKQLLFDHSVYFASLLGDNFCESMASLVYLPANLIKSNALSNIIQYMYTHKIKVDEPSELCDMYTAADYLGMESLCTDLTEHILNTVHSGHCYCNSCVSAVPIFLLFCQSRSLDERTVRLADIFWRILTQEPEKAISTFWTHRHMAIISQTLQDDILARVTKANAIESLYGCFCAFTKLSNNDPLWSWCKPLHGALTSLETKATAIVSEHFEYFCCEYPALICCMDGVSYSIEFLEYLLMHLLEDHMNCKNVGLFYRMVIHLMERSINEKIQSILMTSKSMVLQFVASRIGDIQLISGLSTLEKPDLLLLAHDLDIRPKSLLNKKETNGLGRRVRLSRRAALTVGTVRFVGHVDFDDGLWIGIELDRRVGKNDGSVDGKCYFTCSPNRGIFVRSEDISLI